MTDASIEEGPAFYFLTAAVQAGTWIVMWIAVRRDPLLLKPGCSAEVARTETRQAVVAFVALAVLAMIGLVVPVAALVLYLVAVVGYAFPAMARSRRVRGRGHDLHSLPPRNDPARGRSPASAASPRRETAGRGAWAHLSSIA